MSDPISKIISALKTDTVIPDVIPASYDFIPSVLISVAWPAEGLEIVLGDKVPREKTIEEPAIKLLPLVPPTGFVGTRGGPAVDEAAGDITYTLVMTDPDAPSREDPKFGQWRHWVITGVQLPTGNTDTEGITALKPKVAETSYYPPAPPPGSGFHRYVFLLFQEPSGGINLPSDAIERKGEFEARPKWNALAFAEDYGLKLVGINYFMTQVSK